MMGKTEKNRASIKHRRSDFLFNDGEFKQRIVPLNKKKYLMDIREQELLDEAKAEDCLYEDSKGLR